MKVLFGRSSLRSYLLAIRLWTSIFTVLLPLIKSRALMPTTKLGSFIIVSNDWLTTPFIFVFQSKELSNFKPSFSSKEEL